jgi:hypothetical protein
MPWLSILFALHLLGAAKARFTVVKNRALYFPRPEATSFPTAEFSIPFTGKAPRRKSRSDALAVLRRGVYSAGNSTNTVALDVDRFEVDYLANITIGGQDFTVIVDTGRQVLNLRKWSPTKLTATKFQCRYLDCEKGIQLHDC